MTASLIVGLGNPGSEYQHTRHNLGFRVIDALLEKNNIRVIRGVNESDTTGAWFQVEGFGNEKHLALKPQTFMNEGGPPVQRFVSFYKIPLDRLFVIHDDVDLPFSELRPAFDRGSAGHQGVESIVEALGSKAFHRLRLGIGSNRQHNQAAEDYVLQNFTAEEEQQLTAPDGILAKAAADIITELNANKRDAPA